MDIKLTWTLSDSEHAELQRIVAAEGKGEAIEEYATRVGLKGLRGQIEVKMQERREAAIEAVTRAWIASTPQAQAASLDPLGYEVTPDGSIQRKA